MIRTVSRLALLAATLSAFASPAFAHATLETQEAKIGASYKAVLRVPHGCGTEATHTVRIQIPEGFFAVKPMPKAGWELEIVTGPYENTYLNHGTEVKEGVKEIVWSGGDLPNEFYDEFVFRAYITDDVPAGEMLYIPVVQECANGAERWIEIPAEGQSARDLRYPAPGVMVVAPAGHGHSHGHSHGHTHGN